MTDETNPRDFKNIRGTDNSSITGWGIDANPENDPTYPIKIRTDEEKEGYTWERPPQQTEDVEILRSVERPGLTAAFGTSTPPSGLSGMIRRIAYKYSESSYGRWLPLLVADRLAVLEGVVSDLAHGHIPNIIAERGWHAEWKYNRKAVIKKAAIASLVTAAVVGIILTRKKRRK